MNLDPGGRYFCYWCNVLVGLDLRVSLHMDYIDGDKTNDDVLNVVPSCRLCKLLNEKARIED